MIRKFFFPTITLVTALIFIVRLISLQLINSSYKSLSDDNAVIENEVFPERGYIYDRNNKLLVSNQPVYDLIAIPENITAFDTLQLAKIINISKPELQNKLSTARKFSMKLPYVIVNQISKERNAIIQEKIWKFTGFYLQKKSLREYPNPIASNILGYVSEVNRSDMKKDDYYSQSGADGVFKNNKSGATIVFHNDFCHSSRCHWGVGGPQGLCGGCLFLPCMFRMSTPRYDDW